MDPFRLSLVVSRAERMRTTLSRNEYRATSLRVAICVLSTLVAASTFFPPVVNSLYLTRFRLLLLRVNGAMGAVVSLGYQIAAERQRRRDAAVATPQIYEEPNIPECPAKLVEDIGPVLGWGVHTTLYFQHTLNTVIEASYKTLSATMGVAPMPFGAINPPRIPSEEVIEKFIQNSNLSRIRLGKSLLFTQSEHYKTWKRETFDDHLFHRKELIRGAKELEMAVTHFVRDLKRNGYTFETHSVDAFFHPEELCRAGELVTEDRGAAMQAWQAFCESPDSYYYLGLRKPTELIQQLQQLPGQRMTKSANPRS